MATAACASGAEPPPVNGAKTPLDEYVAKPDPAYEWKVVKTIPGDGVTIGSAAGGAPGGVVPLGAVPMGAVSS